MRMSLSYERIDKYNAIATSTTTMSSTEKTCTCQIKPLFLLLLIISGLTFSVLSITNGTVALKFIEMTSLLQFSFDKASWDYIQDINDTSVDQTPLLTLFTTFRNRKDQWRVHWNVLKNWSLFQPKIKMVLFNDGIDGALLSFAHELNWTILPVPSRSIYGTPRLKEMFFTCQQLIPNSTFYGYANGDILFDQGLVDTLEVISTYLHYISETLVVGMRTNCKIRGRRITSLQEVHTLAKTEGKLFRKDAEDYFLLAHNKFPWKAVPGIVIGRPAYDNFLVATAHKHGVAVVDATKTLVALHQTGFDGDFAGFRNVDSQYNSKVIGKFDYSHGLTSSTQYQTGYNKDGFIELWRRPDYKGPGLLDKNRISTSSTKRPYIVNRTKSFSLSGRKVMPRITASERFVHLTLRQSGLNESRASQTSLHTLSNLTRDPLVSQTHPTIIQNITTKRYNISYKSYISQHSQKTVFFKESKISTRHYNVSYPTRKKPHTKHLPDLNKRYYNTSYSEQVHSHHALIKQHPIKYYNLSNQHPTEPFEKTYDKPNHISYRKIPHLTEKLHHVSATKGFTDRAHNMSNGPWHKNILDIEGEADDEKEKQNNDRFKEVILTLFTVVDTGSTLRVFHLNMIKNWACFHPKVATVLFTDSSDPLVDVMAKEMNWTVLQKVPQLGSVLPLKRMFLQVQDLFPTSTLFGYMKGDLLFGNGLLHTVTEVLNSLDELDSALLVGRKNQYIAIEGQDLFEPSHVDEITKSHTSIVSSHLDSHVLFAHYMFPWQHIPDLVIGHSSYDNYLIALALRHDFAVIDATTTLVALDQISNNPKLVPQSEADDFDANLLGALDYTEAYASSAQYETKYDGQNNVRLWKRKNYQQIPGLLPNNDDG